MFVHLPEVHPECCNHVSIQSSIQKRSAQLSAVELVGDVASYVKPAEQNCAGASNPYPPIARSVESLALTEASPLWSGQLNSTAVAPMRQSAWLSVLRAIQG